IINDHDWYRDNNITLYTGDPVIRIDADQSQFISASGLHVDYDEVNIATGSRAFIPPIPGSDKDGVIGFRDIKDCETMIA
ncbi:FAD-dependent oxidoreductase, partial [Paenibacillus sp. PsM32]|uniref:FAD-dependent oxidoreductase n=1 Tax=Paenibacillus sp. PsM32 TaxID=3030536 RepID=UPI00263A487E